MIFFFGIKVPPNLIYNREQYGERNFNPGRNKLNDKNGSHF